MGAVDKIIGLVVAVYLVAFTMPAALVELGAANLTGAGTAVTSLFGIIGIIVVIVIVKLFISKEKSS